MSREWTVVIKGDWYLPHFVNMLAAYRGNGEQTSCATDVIAQIEAQMIPVDGGVTTTTMRPLVVIDPGDREQVERLVLSAWPRASNKTGLADNLQAALRSLIEPPKPTEVYEHFSEAHMKGVGSGTTDALCGKVWKPCADNTVLVGKCPECVAIVAAGWIA